MSRLWVPTGADEDQGLAAAYGYARRSWLWPLVVAFASAFVGEVVGTNFVPDLVIHLTAVVIGSVGLAAATYTS